MIDLQKTLRRGFIASLAITGFLAFPVSALAAGETDTDISSIPVEELPGAKAEMEPLDEGKKCKRIRKTGSNRITRVCTTRAQREARAAESNEFLREQQLQQERFMIENAGEGGVSPN
jgi:hypothetical protein